jgi:hypothetical protein
MRMTAAEHTHADLSVRRPHCRGCGTAYCKLCDAYGDHLSHEPHPRKAEVAS